MSYRTFALLCFASLLLLSPGRTSELSDTARKLNFFGVQLYAKVAARGGNVAVSPLSVSQSLMMLAGGAQGETRKEILFTLGLNEQNLAAAALIRKRLTENTGNTPDDPAAFRLFFADSIWLNNGLTAKPEYARFLQEGFSAPLRTVSFAPDPEKARQEINLWTMQNTGNLIPDLLPSGSLTTGTKLVLCDAVYFDARWLKLFEGEKTKPEEFHNLPAPARPGEEQPDPAGSSVTVSMMNQTLTTRVEEGKDFRALSLPYLGGKYAMILVVAKDGQPFAAAEKAWPEHENWFQGWEQEVCLALPKFSLGTTASLRDALLMLGVADAFSPEKSDFSGICADKLVLDDVLHGCQIEVKEEGTRAAAATAGTTWGGEPPAPEGTPAFRIDRPFVYLIRHEPTKLVLFAGRVCTLRDEAPKDGPKNIRATGAGYGPWKFGMTMEQVQQVAECGPYRPNAEGGLKCIHAPWQTFNDRHAEFDFDGNGLLTQIRLWLNTSGTKQEQAAENLKAVEEFLAPFGKGKEKGLAEGLIKKVEAAPDKDRPAVEGTDVSAGPGTPRTRVTLTRHPQLGWYVFLTFHPL